jgi:hypothetical protein
MRYYRPVKVISSVGRPGKDGTPGTGAGANVITSDTEPTLRVDGSALVEGDFWWDETDDILHIYIDDAWKLAGGSGAINTSELALANPTTSRFVNAPTTLPDTDGLSTQADYNEWLLQSLYEQDKRIDEIESNNGVGLSDFTYLGISPIDTIQEETSVTHFMDMSNLGNIEDANAFNDLRIAKAKLASRSLNNSVDNGGFTFTAIAPVTVDVQDETVTHGMLISDLQTLL